MGAVYPRLDLNDPIPRFKTLEDWQQRKSTKIDTAAKMILHILSRDDAPMMEFRDGEVFFPEIPPPAPGENVSRLDKVLLYAEFASFGPLIRDVRVLVSSVARMLNLCRSLIFMASLTCIWMATPASKIAPKWSSNITAIRLSGS